MGKKMIHISNLLEGMILGEDIFTDNGIIILQQGAYLTNELIEKIKNFYTSENIFVLQEKNNRIDININEEFEDLIKNYEKEQKFIEQRKTKRTNYANQIRDMEEKLKDYILVEKISQKEFSREISHIVFDIKKFTKDCYNIFSVILSTGNIDNYLYEHTIKSAIVSCMLGKWMNLEEEELNSIIKGSLLKDIGNVKVPKSILAKNEKLSLQEFKEIKKHPLYSYGIVKDMEKIDKKTCQIILQHHEKENGKGYPLGIKGKEIDLLSKIVSIGDMFTAMVSNRAYAKRKSPFQVLEQFRKDAFDILDMSIVMVFIKNFSEYYINVKIKLSNGEIGHIVRLDMNEISKPLVKLSNDEFIDLKYYRDIEIVDVLDKFV